MSVLPITIISKRLFIKYGCLLFRCDGDYKVIRVESIPDCTCSRCLYNDYNISCNVYNNVSSLSYCVVINVVTASPTTSTTASESSLLNSSFTSNTTTDVPSPTSISTPPSELCSVCKPQCSCDPLQLIMLYRAVGAARVIACGDGLALGPELGHVLGL